MKNSHLSEITIPGKFESLNEYITQSRSSVYAGNNMKRRDQNIICRYIPKGAKFTYIKVIFRYFEPTAKRDKDNISGYFHKIFFDALTQAKAIPNDGWNHVGDMEDHYYVDKKNPRIEVVIIDQASG